jgi:FixJ family two-component response regulator
MDEACVAVVDDDPEVLRSLARLFKFRGVNARTYSSAESLLDELVRLRPTCIVADVAMPGLDGLGLQRALETAGLDLPIVFVTAGDDMRASVEAMRHGAVDFIQKPFAENELFAAVDQAVARARGKEADRAIAQAFAQRLALLTAREHDVLVHVANGLLNKQIAGRLGIAEKTVKIHRSRIMHKMAVRSVAELARLVERFGLGPSHCRARRSYCGPGSPRVSTAHGGASGTRRDRRR